MSGSSRAMRCVGRHTGSLVVGLRGAFGSVWVTLKQQGSSRSVAVAANSVKTGRSNRNHDCHTLDLNTIRYKNYRLCSGFTSASAVEVVQVSASRATIHSAKTNLRAPQDSPDSALRRAPSTLSRLCPPSPPATSSRAPLLHQRPHTMLP